MPPLIVHSHPPARLISPATRRPLFTGSDVRSPVTTTEPIMEEHWQSLSLHEAPIDPVPEPNWNSSVVFDDDDDDCNALKSLPEDSRIKHLRFDKYPGIIPPYCAIAPVFFPELRLDRGDPKPSPLRHIALSNIPPNSLERSDSGYESTKEEKPRKKAVSFDETIHVLEIDPDTAVEAQAWAHYPEAAKCKVWDGRSKGYEKRRHLRRKMKQWGLHP